ncbi:MAG: hypothetical protein GY929_18450 [Actinomycetia bacterium]|nr:hypothetical protein [Actinomycetes bacterium]
MTRVWPSVPPPAEYGHVMDARELADALIRRFVDVAITTYLGSIDELATGFGVDPDMVANAIGLLVESGDFICDPHPASVDPSVEMNLSIDWDRFAENQLGIGPGE